MKLLRKLPEPQELRSRYPLRPELVKKRNQKINIIRDILSGKSDRKLIVVGPCSADRADAVIDYVCRLAELQERVADRFLIIPRVFTAKPRTAGDGYKGLLHRPDPDSGRDDLVTGIAAVRSLHLRVIEESGLFAADEMLYPELSVYTEDLLGYCLIGARSSENQQHRLTASGLGIPVGIKNPTSGDFSVMLNSIAAANHPHIFEYRGWEAESEGNHFAHAVLRGRNMQDGKSVSNYNIETVEKLYESYTALGLDITAAVIDCSHANSGKDPQKQAKIAAEVIDDCRKNEIASKFIRGIMLESYIEDGAQRPDCNNKVYGKSLTDPCLGWAATERLILTLAERS